MFKFTYHLVPVKGDIVTLAPTTSTYVKAFLPSLVIGVGFWAYGVYLDREVNRMTSEHDLPLD